MAYKILNSGINGGGMYYTTNVNYVPASSTVAVISKIVIHNYASSTNSAIGRVAVYSMYGDDITTIYQVTLAPGESFEVTGGITISGADGNTLNVYINEAMTPGVTMGAAIFGDAS